MATEGQLDVGLSISDADANGSTLLLAYRFMLQSRLLDDKELQLKRQARAYFHINGAGHEAIQIACALELTPGTDWVFPYYRDRALCLALGVQPLDMLLAAVGAADDPNSHGRQMPSHWSNRQLNIVSGSSATGMQCLHAVGCAEVDLIEPQEGQQSRHDRKQRRVTLVSLGEGATSEGEFWESLAISTLRRLPVLYLIVPC